jgi:glycosyltransferase involved in cell wall biosynthesis
MIIKNEGPILPRLFESVRGFVSEYCVVDTGSTDDTINILKSMEMSGVILEEPFVDFATTRNYMIEKCRQVMTSCDYLVLLDADMVLRVSPEWDWAKLDGQDVYNFIQVSGVEYENVRMIRRDAQDIRVVGATHEYYDVPSGYSQKTLPKALIHIDDVGDGKAKGDKFERDERLLRRELEADPENVRTVFYLANTLKDQGKCAEAIPYYVRRATMGGWFAEADYSLYMLSSCYLALDDLGNARKYGELAAFSGMAKRAEPLYFLAFYLSQRSQYSLAWHYASLAAKIPKPAISAALFISNDIYNYWVDYELASLTRHIFPSQPTLGMQAAMEFWNNGYAFRLV